MSSSLSHLAVYDTMLRPTTTREIPTPTAPKDISNGTSRPSPKTRRSPSFLFDSPPSAPLAPATSNATAVSTSKPTKSSKRDSFLSSPTSPRRSFFPSPTKSSVSSANSGGSSGFAGGIFSLSSLLAKMPSSASIAPILSSSTSSQQPNNTSRSQKMAGGNTKDKAPAAPGGMTAAEKQEAVRNAQAIIASVKKDWEWAEEMRKNRKRKIAAAAGNMSGPTGSTTMPSEEDSEDEDDLEYKSREESDSEDNRSPIPTSAKTSKAAKTEVYPDDEPKSAYRFHGPDTIGTSPTKAERKAQRKKDLEEEMKWNEGLRIFVERRDLWTNANKEGKVPIGKSKFQDNPFYDAVVPDAYPQLYSRIIIKGNTPTIPINLQHMTNAIVEGWKSDGQWPPKPSKPEPSFSRKKGISVGESMVKRVFGIGR